MKRQSLTAAAVCALMTAAALVSGACGRSGARGGSSRRVRVAAAADLRFALAELSARFQTDAGIAVAASYGSSGTFYAQLLNRAPYDVYLSADATYPRQLAARGLADPDSEFIYAIGRLVAWVPAGSPLAGPIHADGLQALAAESVSHVAIANPEHAPYGRAAVAALRRTGIYDALQAKLVYGENVEQALQFAESGAADAAVVALSLAAAPTVKGTGQYVEVPSDAYPPITQAGVILKAAADEDAARAFRTFMLGETARAILRQYGFAAPDR